MAEINMSQAMADELIRMEKHRVDDNRWMFPGLPPNHGMISIPLVSVDKREGFLLDIRNGRIDLSKATYQNRTRQVVILVRLDLGEKSHRNPDGQTVGSPHIHLYREGYGDKWAFVPAREKFKNTQDKWQSLQDFMAFCNILKPPVIERGLFI